MTPPISRAAYISYGWEGSRTTRSIRGAKPPSQTSMGMIVGNICQVAPPSTLRCTPASVVPTSNTSESAGCTVTDQVVPNPSRPSDPQDFAAVTAAIGARLGRSVDGAGIRWIHCQSAHLRPLREATSKSLPGIAVVRAAKESEVLLAVVGGPRARTHVELSCHLSASSGSGVPLTRSCVSGRDFLSSHALICLSGDESRVVLQRGVGMNRMRWKTTGRQILGTVPQSQNGEASWPKRSTQ